MQPLQSTDICKDQNFGNMIKTTTWIPFLELQSLDATLEIFQNDTLQCISSNENQHVKAN